MTTPDTPKDFRVAARLLRRADFRETCGNYEAEAKWFERKADEIEREQAAEERIDELAQVSFAAEHAYVMAEQPSTNLIDWDGSSEFQRNVTRTGVRALLAHLEQDVVDAEVYGVRDNGDVLLTASDAASVTAVLRFVFGRHNGERYPASDIETLKFYFWPADMSCTFHVGAKLDDEPKFDQGGIVIKPVRQWRDLRYVPEDVKVVRDPKGIEWHRTPSGGWALDASTWTPGRESSPFTEVIADA